MAGPPSKPEDFNIPNPQPPNRQTPQPLHKTPKSPEPESLTHPTETPIGSAYWSPTAYVDPKRRSDRGGRFTHCEAKRGQTQRARCSAFWCFPARFGAFPALFGAFSRVAPPSVFQNLCKTGPAPKYQQCRKTAWDRKRAQQQQKYLQYHENKTRFLAVYYRQEQGIRRKV